MTKGIVMVKEDILSMIYKDVSPAIRSGSMSGKDRLWIRDGSMLWIAGDNSSLSPVNVNDIVSVGIDAASGSGDKLTRLAALILRKYPGINILLLNRSNYPATVSLTGETLKPYVDDIAQIIGIDIKNFPVDEAAKISALFRSRSAVTIAGEGILCAGTSMDDAVAVAIVAGKAAFIHIRGSYIGSLSFIGMIESAFMRFIYRRKYSKQAALAGRK